MKPVSLIQAVHRLKDKGISKDDVLYYLETDCSNPILIAKAINFVYEGTL